jgi:hypothetical protein
MLSYAQIHQKYLTLNYALVLTAVDVQTVVLLAVIPCSTVCGYFRNLQDHFAREVSYV